MAFYSTKIRIGSTSFNSDERNVVFFSLMATHHHHAKRIEAKELGDVLADHEKWLASDGKAGKFANLSGFNLENIDLSFRNLGKIVLKGARLQSANLHGANLEEANLAEADLSAANLRQASLQKSILCDVEFQNADVQDARIHDSDLSGADLTKANGLVSTQLGGTNLLRAKLPDSVHVESSIGEIGELAKTAKIVFLSCCLACFYSWITIGSTSDAHLLTNTRASKLPLLGVEMPISIFYFVGPIILLCTFLYLHIYLQRLWERLSSLPAIFQDGHTLDEKVYPWFFVGFARSHLPRLRNRRPAFSRFQFIACVVLAYSLIPITL